MTVRTRTAVVCAAAAATALLAYYLIAWAQVSPLRERGTDFSASYVAALLVRDGQGPSLYDQRAEHARHVQLLPAGTVIDLPFITPPTTALLAMPFTLTDPGTAFRLWSLCQLALLALAIVIASRAATWEDVDSEGRKLKRSLGVVNLGGATLDNEENYCIKKLMTALGFVQVENQARI